MKGLLLIVVAHLFLETTFAAGAHGEACVNHRDCNINSLLYCNKEKVCDCSDDSIVYDTGLKNCALKILEPCGGDSYPCVGNASCSLSSNFWDYEVPQSIKRRLLTEQLYQGNTTMCHCNKGFYDADWLKVCLPHAKYNENCENLTCDRTLVCQENKTCGCGAGVVFDILVEKCVIPMGHNCTKFSHCTKNSGCSELIEEVLQMYDLPGYYARPNRGKQSICECFPGFSANSQRNCVGDYFNYCSEMEPCNTEKGLECINGQCHCKHGNTQIYSQHLGYCELSAGGNCSLQSGLLCHPAFKCVNDLCTSNETMELLNAGQKCATDTELKPGRVCNPNRGLACIKGMCSCFDPSLKLDNETGHCMGIEGGACGTVSLGLWNMNRFPANNNVRTGDPAHPDLSFYVSCDKGLECAEVEEKTYFNCRKTW